MRPIRNLSVVQVSSVVKGDRRVDDDDDGGGGDIGSSVSLRQTFPMRAWRIPSLAKQRSGPKCSGRDTRPTRGALV